MMTPYGSVLQERQKSLREAKTWLEKAEANGNLPQKYRNKARRRHAIVNYVLEHKVCQEPWYYVYVLAYRSMIRKKLQCGALQRSVDAALRIIAKQKGLRFESDISVNKTKDIALLLLRGKTPLNALQLTSIKPEDSTKKAGPHQLTLKKIQIKQFLNHFEPGPGQESWSSNDVQSFLTLIDPHVKAAEHLAKPCGAMDPSKVVDIMLGRMAGQPCGSRRLRLKSIKTEQILQIPFADPDFIDKSNFLIGNEEEFKLEFQLFLNLQDDKDKDTHLRLK